MKVRSLILALVITLAAVGPLGAAQGLSYMRATYGGACSRLTGIPGFLQKMNLVAVGNCSVDKNGKCLAAGSPCHLNPPSGSTNGICTKLTGKTGGCSCVPN